MSVTCLALYCICVCAHQARLEVHRFGITGYKKEQQRVFEQDRAVMLGARVTLHMFKKHHNPLNS